MKHWLIIYDICNEKRLSKVAKIMEQYAIRVQKSIFEMEGPEKEVHKLQGNVEAVMEYEDSVIYFSVCEEDWQKREKYGVGSRIDTEDKDYYIL